MQAEGLAHAHFQYDQYNTADFALPTTASPRLALFCADETGAVKVTVNPSGSSARPQNVHYEDLGGGRFAAERSWQGNFELDGGAIIPQGAATSGVDNRKLLTEIKFDAYDISESGFPEPMGSSRLKAGGWYCLRGQQAPRRGLSQGVPRWDPHSRFKRVRVSRGCAEPIRHAGEDRRCSSRSWNRRSVIRPAQIAYALSLRPCSFVSHPQSSNRLLPLPDRNRNPMPIPRAERALNRPRKVADQPEACGLVFDRAVKHR